jgi:hypothetical protein
MISLHHNNNNNSSSTQKNPSRSEREKEKEKEETIKSERGSCQRRAGEKEKKYRLRTGKVFWFLRLDVEQSNFEGRTLVVHFQTL